MKFRPFARVCAKNFGGGHRDDQFDIRGASLSAQVTNGLLDEPERTGTDEDDG
jgi:hypothetical protein